MHSRIYLCFRVEYRLIKPETRTVGEGGVTNILADEANESIMYLLAYLTLLFPYLSVNHQNCSNFYKYAKFES